MEINPSCTQQPSLHLNPAAERKCPRNLWVLQPASWTQLLTGVRESKKKVRSCWSQWLQGRERDKGPRKREWKLRKGESTFWRSRSLWWRAGKRDRNPTPGLVSVWFRLSSQQIRIHIYGSQLPPIIRATDIQHHFENWLWGSLPFWCAINTSNLWDRKFLSFLLSCYFKRIPEKISQKYLRRGWEASFFKLRPQTRDNARNTHEKTNKVVPLLVGITILTPVNFPLRRQIILWNFVSRSTTSFPGPC